MTKILLAICALAAGLWIAADAIGNYAEDINPYEAIDEEAELWENGDDE